MAHICANRLIAVRVDSFDKFPTSLMSEGKTNNNGDVFIFTKDGATVHKEEDMLITYTGAPILIRVGDKRGRYQMPLV